MNVKLTQVTPDSIVNEAAGVSTGNKVKVKLAKWLASEHSPIRELLFLVEFEGIPAYVAAHLKTHNRDIVHQTTESNRADYPTKFGKKVSEDRNTPVNHRMMLNAQSLIQISRSRICNEASVDTIKAWRLVREKVREINPDLANLMVPECVYRNGLCPHFKSKCRYFETNKYRGEVKLYRTYFRTNGDTSRSSDTELHSNDLRGVGSDAEVSSKDTKCIKQTNWLSQLWDRLNRRGEGNVKSIEQ